MRCLPLRALFPVLGAAALGCGGSTAATHDGGSDAASSSDSPVEASGDSSVADTGFDSGCPRPPSSPVYACDAGAPDAQGCGPWGSSAASPRYPEGCVVTTTMEGTYCGPVTCNCTTASLDGGATWLCPL